MVVLKKIHAATLMETMVATVLIIIIFMLASTVMNNVFQATVQGSSQTVIERTQKLEYELSRGSIQLPYFEELEGWEIEISNEEIGTANEVVLKVSEIDSGKQIISRVL